MYQLSRVRYALSETVRINRLLRSDTEDRIYPSKNDPSTLHAVTRYTHHSPIPSSLHYTILHYTALLYSTYRHANLMPAVFVCTPFIHKG